MTRDPSWGPDTPQPPVALCGKLDGPGSTTRWHVVAALARRRFGQLEHKSRLRYAKLSKASNHTYTSFMDGSSPEGFMPLGQQLRFRYTFSTDGLGVSSRLAKVLATGQVRNRGQAHPSQERCLVSRPNACSCPCPMHPSQLSTFMASVSDGYPVR